MKTINDKPLDIDSILKKYWGYSDFRPMQREIINSVLAHRDTLALLPTGGGKSLTYQVPALAMEGLCIVVTPLIALMKDQVDRLRKLSIPAIAIHSGLSPRQIDIGLDNCIYGDIKFLYVSPERVASELFRLRVQKMKVSLLAVDEAHCISQWGYDFRPSYLRISELREHTNYAPILALTASATHSVLLDIIKQLSLKDELVLKGSFTRSNLTYAVRNNEDKNGQLAKIINSVEGSGIIYVRSRKATEELSKSLNDSGISSTFYHAGLPLTHRAINQEEWLNNEVRIIVATNAFGMGIDKPDVRFVVHFSLSNSLEAYYQEAGRAGRDGKRSYAVLLYNKSDIARINTAITNEFPPIEQIKNIYDSICSYLQIPFEDGEFRTYTFNIYEFCAQIKLPKTTVVNAIKILEANNYMTFIEDMANPARLMFCVSRDDLYKVRVSHEELDHFLRVILRLYEGIFTDFRKIDELEIAHWSGYTPHKVGELLKRLWQLRLVRYIPANNSPMIHLHTSRPPIKDLYISPASYKLRKEIAIERFEAMSQYTTNIQQCRSRFFESYFGLEESDECGVCDICLEKKRKNKAGSADQIEQKIIELLKSKGELKIKDIDLNIKASSDKIAAKIDKMINDHKIIFLDNGKIKLEEQS